MNDVIIHQNTKCQMLKLSIFLSYSGGGMGWIIPVTVVVLGVALAYRFFSQQS